MGQLAAIVDRVAISMSCSPVLAKFACDGLAGANVQHRVPLIVNIMLFSVFINDFVGPSISKFGITYSVVAKP